MADAGWQRRAAGSTMVGVQPGVLVGPVMAMAVLGLLAVMLRWTFGTTRSMSGPNRSGHGDGLLTEVGVVPTAESAAVLRRRLAESGVRATVSPGDTGGYRLLVFSGDEASARTVLSRNSLG